MQNEAGQQQSSAKTEMARAAALLDGVQDAFYALDEDWRFTYFNKAAASHFGIASSDVIGRTLFDVLGHISRDIFLVIEGAQTGHCREIEFHSKVTQRTIALRAFPIEGGCGVTFRDLTEHRRLELEADARAAELQTIYDNAPVGLALLDQDLRYLRINAALERMNGLPAAGHIGRRVQEVVPHCAAEVLGPFMEVVRTGKVATDIEVSVEVPDHPGMVRTFLENIAPVRRTDGQVDCVLVSVLEITRRKQAEARAALLLAELDHRIKNILATVQSIAAQTLRTTTSLREFEQAFVSRLVAMAQTHELLKAENWQSADLATLLDKELSPYREEGRFATAGAPVRLSPSAALAVGLIVHELATNAVKYGALSTLAGRVSIDWTINERGLRLVWAETGGPAVHKPERCGFGSRLIERSLAGDLGGCAHLIFEPEGLRCIIDLPPKAVVPIPQAA